MSNPRSAFPVYYTSKAHLMRTQLVTQKLHFYQQSLFHILLSETSYIGKSAVLPVYLHLHWRLFASTALLVRDSYLFTPATNITMPAKVCNTDMA